VSVYFITAREFNRVKIGYTAGDPKIRRNKIRADCPTPVALEAVLDGHRDLEQSLHERFHAARVCGEWFIITAEIEALILEHRVPTPPLKRHHAPVRVHPSVADLAQEMVQFCTAHRLMPSDFSRRAVNDRSFLTSVLTRQRRVWPETEAKVRRFMATYRPDTSQDAAA
jgi:hypothetical protein